MLTFARQATYMPGSNLRSDDCPPLWWFLLPSLDIDTVTVVGRETRLSGELAKLGLRRAGPDAHTPLLYVTARAAGSVAPGADQITIIEGTVASSQSATPALWVPQISRLQSTWGRQLRRAGRLVRLVRGRCRASAPPVSEARPVDPTVPARDAVYTILAGPGTDMRSVPAYVAREAQGAGIDLWDKPWALIPPRGYRQQKVVFLAGDADEEMVAVKLTQHPSANPRLENEYRSLVHVLQHRLVPSATVPKPLFRSEHAGLTMVGEEGVRGHRFTLGCDGSARHPRAEQVVAWIDQLGLNSVHQVTGLEYAEAFADMAERLAVTYRNNRLAEALLSEANLLAQAGSLPAVFGHGDLGFWNTLVRPDGTVAVFDWENAEFSSPPTWDLIHFIQSYGKWATSRQRIRYSTATFAGQLFDSGSEWAKWLWGSAIAHADSIGLPKELVWPLAKAHWGFMALKESTRLRPAHLGRGTAIRTLEAAFRHRSPLS